MGINEDHIPRKQEKAYAKAALWIVEEARAVCGCKQAGQELLLIGDTLYNDGQAYRNMARVSGWQGSCFIGADRLEQAPSYTIDSEQQLYSANRWSALPAWLLWLRQQGLQLDTTTSIIIDIDKTALGPKGRNDQVIDRARLQGIFRTMDAVLGERFDRTTFVQHYSELNRSKYHFLTADNQDYLVYICLILNAKLIGFNDLLDEIQQKSLDNFDQFIRWVDSLMRQQVEDSETLREVHEAVLASVRIGDPTPFKRFRRQEFISTVEHMGSLSDDTPVEELLKGEITLNEEVLQVASWLKQRGCFLLCLSDKPDESSKPSGRDTTHYAPVHRVATHRVGVNIQDALDEIR
jgi:hypothetical protein